MDWITAARDLGFPAVLICGLSYAIWTAGIWLGKELLVPLRNRHFDFLTSLEQTNKTIAESIREIHTRVTELQCLRRE
jgi:hypothetical protein